MAPPRVEPTDLERQLSKLREQKLIIEQRELCRASFEAFVRLAWPHYLPGRALQWNWHLSAACAHLEAVRNGDITRLIWNIPPRQGKSSIFDVMFPAWMWIDEPHTQFLTLSHSEKLATRDAVFTRRLLSSPWYQTLFGDSFKFTGDQNEKQRYQNDAHGHRIALGIQSRVTGEGGDVIIVDDPHGAEEALSEASCQSVLDAYDGMISTRLNDPVRGAIIIVMQRLSEMDLTAHLMSKGNFEGWVNVAIPMRYTGTSFSSPLSIKDPRTEKDQLLWPERFPDKKVRVLEQRLGPYRAAAQLQQNPAPLEGGIIKRVWFKPWTKSTSDGKIVIPDCKTVVVSLDTAYTARDTGRDEAFDPNRSQSACSVWGSFFNETTNRSEILLIEAWADYLDYHDLRKKALETYRRAFQYCENGYPTFIVEKKSSGISLLQDLRRAGIGALPYMPDRDKVARIYAVQPTLASKLVSFISTPGTEELISQLCTAPRPQKLDDLADTASMALLRFIRLQEATLPEDDDEQTSETKSGTSPFSSERTATLW